MQLFNIVSRHNNWLAVRQTAVAGNIANANTPGFRAQDVQPFEMAARAGAPGDGGDAARTSVVRSAGCAGHGTAPRGPWEITHSGNNVSLEQELLKAGEVNRAFRLNTSVAKAFHRMILTSSRV